MASEDLETMVTVASRAQSKVTLNELLDTLKLLEEEPELLPLPKACKEDKYAWIDGVTRTEEVKPMLQWACGQFRTEILSWCLIYLSWHCQVLCQL